MAHSDRRTSPLRIVVPWIVVLMPLGWGVFQTVVKSLPLFQGAPVSSTVSKLPPR